MGFAKVDPEEYWAHSPDGNERKKLRAAVKEHLDRDLSK